MRSLVHNRHRYHNQFRNKKKNSLEVKIPIRKLFRYSDTEMETNLSNNLRNKKKEKKLLIRKNIEYKNNVEINDKVAAINRIAICQVIDSKLMNSNYLVSSKKNCKDTDKEESSSSVQLQKSNIEA